MRLSDEQLRIIELTKAGGHAVFAGPGSGKTALLVERVKIVSKERVPLCLTFTRNAAREMAERANVPNAEFRTLDSLAYQFWKQNAWRYDLDTRGWEMMSERDKLNVAREVCKKLMPRKYSPSDLVRAIGRMKRLGGYPFVLHMDLDETLEFEREMGLYEDELLTLMHAYESFKHKHKMLEFEDLELFMCSVLEDGDVVFNAEDLSVDEAHDLSALQWRMLELIQTPNLFIVASPEQSIYGFRQAKPEYLGEFIKRKELKVHRLKANFRSARKIIHVANKIYPVSEPVREEEGRAEYLGHFDSQREEARAIMERIDARPTAILVRTNMQALPFIVEALNLRRRYKTARSIFERSSVKLLLDWLRVGANQDLEALKRVVAAMELQPDATLKSAKQAVELTDAKLAIAFVRKSLGLDTHIAMHAAEDEDYEDEMWLLDYVEMFGAGKSVDEFLSWVEEMQALESDDAPLWIGTIHAAKGLEWDVVYVAGVTEGVLPHVHGDKDEELRLFYVAITRARDELYLSSCVIRRFTKPSRYLDILGEAVVSVTRRETAAERGR